jgi:hypothetical protein
MMAGPAEGELFESARLRIRRGTLRRNVPSGIDESNPLEPDELFDGVECDEAKKEPPTPEGAGG